jgi:acetyl esterase/lipase
MVQRLSEATNCEVLLARHRLAPEHPFPTAPEDVAVEYLNILNRGYEAQDIFLGADTAGASVALGAMQLLKRQKADLPAGVVLFSPWCDLSLSGWSYITSSITSKSPFRMETAAFCARLYLQGSSATDPIASPIFADLSDLPPMLIHTSENDMHFDDAMKLTENGKRDGCDVRLNYWDSPRHHLERLSSKDAERSYAEVSKFIDRVWMH